MKITTIIMGLILVMSIFIIGCSEITNFEECVDAGGCGTVKLRSHPE